MFIPTFRYGVVSKRGVFTEPNLRHLERTKNENFPDKLRQEIKAENEKTIILTKITFNRYNTLQFLTNILLVDKNF